MPEQGRRCITRDHFSMKHENPTIFVTSQWQQKTTPNPWYLVYRLLLAIFAVIALIFSILDLRVPNQSIAQRVKWLIYLTSWGFTLITIQGVLAAIMIINFFLASRRKESTGELSTSPFRDIVGGPTIGEGDDKSGGNLYKVYWATNVAATDLAFGITIIYWSLVYDEKKMPLDAMNIIVHVLNSLIMLMDACITAHPVRLLHCYWPLLLGVLYAIFTAIYYLAGGVNKEGSHYIYKILDWSKPEQALITCAGVTIFLVLIHVSYYALYRVRLRVYTIRRTHDHIKEKNSHQMWYDNNALASELI